MKSKRKLKVPVEIEEKKESPNLGGFMSNPPYSCKHITLFKGFKYVDMTICEYYCEEGCFKFAGKELKK